MDAFEDVGDAAAAQRFFDVEAVGFIVFEEDVDLVDAAEEVVEVAHDVLIGAGEKHTEVVRFPVERVERDVVLGVLQIDEAADLAVGVARDVGEDGVDRGLFVEAMEWGDGEKLLERPVIEKRLEDREIADVLVGEELVEIVEFLGLIAGFLAFFGDLFADLPKQGFGGGAVFEVEVTEIKERQRFFLFLRGVVKTFEATELGLVFQHDFKVFDDFVFDLGLVLLAERFAFVDALEDFDDEERVRGYDGAAGFAHDVGHSDARGGANLADVEDDVAGVFFHRVVHRALEVCAGAVVVDAETAADIEVTHREAHLRELAIEARGFDDGVLDRDDVGDLRADMKMDEAQAGLEFGFAELFAREENFGRVEAELGVVAGGHGPFAFAARLEFGAETDHGLHADFLGDFDDVVDFGELLDDEDDFLAELAGEEREADVIVILVAVADDEAVGAFVHRDGDHQLGLGAGFEAVIKIFAGGDDLVDDFAQLVDLDREYAAVAAFVALLFNGFVEDAVELGDAMAQEILETDHQRSLEAHADGFVNHVERADAAAVGERLDVQEAGVVDGEVAGAPALEPIEFFGLGGGPGGGGFTFQCGSGGGDRACFCSLRIDFLYVSFFKIRNTQ